MRLPARSDRRRGREALTLVEVMVALGIFFMAVFTILALVSNTLRNARALQQTTVDAGMVAAQVTFQLSNTNQVSEGLDSGDFGDLYPDYTWTRDLYEVGTNGLCQVDIVVERRSGVQRVESQLSILVYLPNLQRGSLTGGFKR